MASEKAIHTIVLDTGSVIRNEPSASTLMSQAESIVTVPAIISEIKDAATRSRFETTLKPFVTLRSPKPASLRFVTDFARKTGDLAVLSRPDIEIIALTYELECERNGGDWRLRRVPGQKRMNGPPPGKPETAETPAEGEEAPQPEEPAQPEEPIETSASDGVEKVDAVATADSQAVNEEQIPLAEAPSIPAQVDTQSQEPVIEAVLDTNDSSLRVVEETLADLAINTQPQPEQQDADAIDEQDDKVDSAQNSGEGHDDDSESDSDSGGWITPSNLKKKQAADASGNQKQEEEQKIMQVAVVTTDFAMQNVILQMNLNLLSPSMFRVKRLNTYVLRCHACFTVCKDLTKQFCPRCGQATLTRVACSTSANGEFRLHLKKNMQWNHRGDRYSIPKPVHGSSNGKIKGGGKNGWGNDLMLAEDQKEYQNASQVQKRQKEKNLMDEDYLPSILTGDRGKSGGRIKVGAGRNINARKR